MIYSENFKETVDLSLINQFYLGDGNPNSNILLIGKELASCDNNHYENAISWKKNIENPHYEIPNWRENGIDRKEFFNPLHPFKGMKLNDQKEVETWRKYQKLIDFINNIENENKDQLYTFHQESFLTELNDNPSKYSNLQIEEKRRKSINDRIGNFFSLPFIQSFPIVIMANSHYVRDYKINICKLFDVEYEGKPRIVNDNKNQWYNIHINEKTPKLVIHTRQLSSNITDDLLKEIALSVQNFRIKFKIN